MARPRKSSAETKGSYGDSSDDHDHSSHDSSSSSSIPVHIAPSGFVRGSMVDLHVSTQVNKRGQAAASPTKGDNKADHGHEDCGQDCDDGDDFGSGSGTTGDFSLSPSHRRRVVQARRRDTGGFLAVKIMPTQNSKQRQRIVKRFKHVRRVTQRTPFLCHHQEVASVTPTSKIAKNKDVWVYMEYCDRGTLQDLLDSQQELPFTVAVAADICASLVGGLAELHSQGLTHANLKPSAVLFTLRGQCKLGGFRGPGDDWSKRSAPATISTPPESSVGGTWDDKSDVWAMGILMMHVYDNIKNKLLAAKAEAKAKRKQRSSSLDDEEESLHNLRRFIRKCLRQSPQQRSSTAQLVMHPFVADRITMLQRRKGCSNRIQSHLISHTELLERCNKRHQSTRSRFLDTEEEDDDDEDESISRDVLTAALHDAYLLTQKKGSAPKEVAEIAPADSHPFTPRGSILCSNCSTRLRYSAVARRMGYVCGHCFMAHGPTLLAEESLGDGFSVLLDSFNQTPEGEEHREEAKLVEEETDTVVPPLGDDDEHEVSSGLPPPPAWDAAPEDLSEPPPSFFD